MKTRTFYRYDDSITTKKILRSKELFTEHVDSIITKRLRSKGLFKFGPRIFLYFYASMPNEKMIRLMEEKGSWIYRQVQMRGTVGPCSRPRSAAVKWISCRRGPHVPPAVSPVDSSVQLSDRQTRQGTAGPVQATLSGHVPPTKILRFEIIDVPTAD